MGFHSVTPGSMVRRFLLESKKSAENPNRFLAEFHRINCTQASINAINKKSILYPLSRGLSTTALTMASNSVGGEKYAAEESYRAR